MKLKFKKQEFQAHAVASVLDCFAGQPKSANRRYRIDPGFDSIPPENRTGQSGMDMELALAGFKNAEMQLDQHQLLSNIHKIQQRQNLPLSDSLVPSAGCRINLDVEMETGTGKTYCYINTPFRDAQAVRLEQVHCSSSQHRYSRRCVEIA